MDHLYYTASINCCKKTFYCNDNTITEFGIIDSKNSSTAYVILYELIDIWVLDSNRRVGVWSLPWCWHILSIPLTTGRGTGTETCGYWMMCFLLMTFVPVQKLCVNSYMHSLHGFCYRMYIYIQQECHSVLGKLHPITFYRTVFLGSARFLGWMPLFVFFGLPIVSCSLIKSLILGCSWLLVFVLNHTLILGIWCSAISHLPGCFCPWTFFQNMGFNMVPSDPFMSHLATQLGYSAGEFQALQLIVLVAFGVVD